VTAHGALLLELHGLSAEAHGALSIAVHRASTGMQEPALLEVAREVAAEIELDLASLATTAEPAEHLVLILDHPLYMPTYAWLLANGEVSPAGVRRVSAILRPIAGAVSGTTRIEPGAVTESVLLMLYALRDGVPEYQPSDWARAAPGAPFRLRTTATGVHAVVACRSSTRWRTCSCRR
jgi:hypothetical protein